MTLFGIGALRQTLINTAVSWNPLNVKEMVHALELHGINTRKDIVEGILDRAVESLTLLARLAAERKDWSSDGDYTRSSECAIHLLAKMKHYRAQLAVRAAIIKYDAECDLWLTDEAPYVLASMGPGAISVLIELMQYGGTDMFVRRSTAEALVMIIMAHPETKSQIVSSIMGAAQKESDIDMRTHLVDTLLDLRDPKLYAYLKNSLKTGFIKSNVFTLYDIDREYARQDPLHKQLIDPLYIFAYNQR